MIIRDYAFARSVAHFHVNGLKSGTRNGSKSLVFRVTTVRRCMIAVAASMETGQSAGQLLQNALGPSEIGQTIAAAIIGSVWILYIFKSKRVANTFTV